MLTRERPPAPCAGFMPPTAPLAGLPAAMSRRAAIFGAVASTGALAAAAVCEATDIGMPMTLSAAPAFPAGPLTLAQAEALDVGALWASLPAEVQARIGTLAIRNELFLLLQEDGGFHTTEEDRLAAEGPANEALEALRPAIWAALPTVLPTTYDEPYPLWQALDGRRAPAVVDVRGLGRCALVKQGGGWFAVAGSALVELGGAVDLNSRDESAPARWLFWTVDDIDAERLRRHPELATFKAAA